MDYVSLLIYFGLFWEANQDDDEVVSDLWPSVQWDGHAAGGALMQGTVGEGAQQEPGQLADMGHTFNELLRPVEEEERNA